MFIYSISSDYFVLTKFHGHIEKKKTVLFSFNLSTISSEDYENKLPRYVCLVPLYNYGHLSLDIINIPSKISD